MYKPKNNKELWAFIGANFGVWLPFKKFTPSHSTPFGFVADCFFNPDKDVAAWASRSGIKTLGASIVAALEYRFTDNLKSRVLAGSEDQARNMYDYWSKWCDLLLTDRLDNGKVNKLLTEVGGGKLAILAASQKRVRGPKVQRLYEDELDEIDEDVDTAAVGMIDSRPGLPGRTIYTSTWHKPMGLMGKLIAKCPGNGVRLHKWNIWESLANCPPERHLQGEGCQSCTLGPTCLEKGREVHGERHKIGIAAEAGGLYQIDDACKAYAKISAGSWESEFLCIRPSVDGLVYPNFDPQVHVVDNAPAGLRCYRAIDWGINVFGCVWFGEAKDGAIYILDTYRAEHGSLKTHADYINAHTPNLIAANYCDPAGRSRNDQTGKSNVDLFKSWGISCKYTTSKKLVNIQNGIQLVRAKIKPATGKPKLYVVRSKNNQAFITAMQSYHNRKVNSIWIDEPQDPQEYEHIPDILRYFVINRSVSHGVEMKGFGTG